MGISLRDTRALSPPYSFGGQAQAWEFKIADAMCRELNAAGRPWSALFASESVVCESRLNPFYEDASVLAKLQVAVVPLTIADEHVARSRRKFDYGLGVDLQRIVAPADTVTQRRLSLAAQQIHDWFANAHQLDRLAGWFTLNAHREDVYSLPQLYAEHTWETLISVAVRGHRT